MQQILFLFLCLILLASCGKSQKVKERELAKRCEDIARDNLNLIDQINLESITEEKSGHIVKMNTKSQNAKDINIKCILVFDGTAPSFDQYIETISIEIDGKKIDLY